MKRDQFRRLSAVIPLLVLFMLCCDDAIPTPSARSPRERWRLSLSETEFHNWFGVPTAVANRAYWKTLDGVLAFDLTTGQRLWKTTLPVGSLNAPNVIVRDGMVVTSDWWGMAALDATTGALRWIHADSARRHDVFIDGNRGMLFTLESMDYDMQPPYSGTVVARDLATGEPRWRRALYEGQEFTIIGTGTVVADDVVYAIGSRSLSRTGHIKKTFVAALRAIDGEVLWRVESEGDFHAPTLSATVYGDLLLMGDHFVSGFYALRRNDGVEIWRLSGTPGYIGPYHPPLVADGIAYAVSGDRTAQAFDPATGKLMWRTELPASARQLALCGRYLLVESQAVMILDRATGRIVDTLLGGESGRDIPVSGFAVFGDVAAIGTDSDIVGFSCR